MNLTRDKESFLKTKEPENDLEKFLVPMHYQKLTTHIARYLFFFNPANRSLSIINTIQTELLFLGGGGGLPNVGYTGMCH